MAETITPLKRQREETQILLEEEEIEETKRQRVPLPYNQILSILEDEEDETHQDDLSSLMTSLQQELSSSSHPLPQTTPSESAGPIHPPTTTTTTTTIDPSCSSSPLLFKDYNKEEEQGSTIIRHLLEASDDELGIPQTQIRLQTKYDQEEDIIHGGGGVHSGTVSNNGEGGTTAISSLFDFHDGFWDFEDFDQTAHYYTFPQSELFM